MSATVNGIRVLACHVNLPAWGAWFCDAEIEKPEAIAGAATIVIGDLTLRGTVLSSGVYKASRGRVRIVGGGGGWGKNVRALAYANDAGVKLSTVLVDAARLCGETIGTVTGLVGGPAYIRPEGPASSVLEDLVPRGWYIDEAGVTQIGRRSAVTYTGTATRIETDAAQGRIELAADAIATLLPGAVVDGVEAVDVEHVLDGGKLRTTVWGRRTDRTGNPAASALARTVELLTAHHRFYAPWEYRVVTRTGERLNLQIVRVSSGMPDLRSVRVRPGVAGMRGRPKLGSLVTVRFANGDAARPFVESFDDADSPGFVADEIIMQAGAHSVGPADELPAEHATSAESLVLAFQCILGALGLQLNALPVNPLTTATLGAMLVTPANASFIGPGVTAMGAGATGTITATTLTALVAALAAKASSADNSRPNIGWPKVKGN